MSNVQAGLMRSSVRPKATKEMDMGYTGCMHKLDFPFSCNPILAYMLCVCNGCINAHGL